MKEIFNAIDDAYFLLDKCITKLLKGRINKDEKLEQEAYCDMESAVCGTMQNLAYLYDRLKGETLNDWIKVTDRLPEKGQLCIMRTNSGLLEVGTFEILEDGFAGFRIKTSAVLLTISSITHWQEIVPPKED